MISITILFTRIQLVKLFISNIQEIKNKFLLLLYINININIYYVYNKNIELRSIYIYFLYTTKIFHSIFKIKYNHFNQHIVTGLCQYVVSNRSSPKVNNLRVQISQLLYYNNYTSLLLINFKIYYL